MSLAGQTGHELHLPVPRTSLVGREREIDDIASLLAAPTVPMVTVAGPGGVGKTRLAIGVAQKLADAFDGGVWFVPLAGVSDPDLVLPTVAQMIGVRESGGPGLVERISGRLRESSTLLILDNFEHLVAAATDLSNLLYLSSGLKVLVTSRVLLRISGEHVILLTGLSLPRRTVEVDPPRLLESDAVHLFVERAREAQARFALTASNSPAVVEICSHLDGLPLSIELAAARVRDLPVEHLSNRLSGQLAMLHSDARDTPPRHGSVRGTIDWSVQLLGRDERQAFAALSTFRAGFTLHAAEAVIGGFEHGRSGDLSAFDILESLVNQSLLEPASTSSGPAGFRMLHTVREFASELLAATDAAGEVGKRHAMYFLELAERAKPHLTTAEQVRWQDELEACIADLRAAMDWLGAHGAPDLRLRLAVALWRFGYARGRMTEARTWLSVARLASAERTALVAESLNAEGLLAAMQDDLDVAMTLLDQAMDLSRILGDDQNAARASSGLGDVAAARGLTTIASDHYERARRLFYAIGDVGAEGRVLTNLGNLHWDAHQLESAVEFHRLALGRYDLSGDLRGTVWSLTSLGTLLVELGRHEEGKPHLRDALARARELGDPGSVVNVIEGFADLAMARGDDVTAVVLTANSESLRARIGMPHLGNFVRRYEQKELGLRVALGDGFDAAWERGLAMSMDDAAALAVDSSASPVGNAAAGGATPAAGVPSGVTDREAQILRMVAAGMSDRQIAASLGISYRTVGTHVSNILGKLGLQSRSALAAFAHRSGLA